VKTVVLIIIAIDCFYELTVTVLQLWPIGRILLLKQGCYIQGSSKQVNHRTNLSIKS